MDTLQDIWNAVLELLGQAHSEVEMNLWLNPLKATEFNDDSITLSVPSLFKKRVIINKYDAEIREKFIDIMGFPVKTVYIAEDEEPQAPVKEPEKPVEKVNTLSISSDKADVTSPNYEFSFDNFIVGESNKLPYNASRAVADRPGVTYNPLLIYGRSGLGKTHLLLAIYNKIIMDNPNAVIHYTTGEALMNELISCIRNKNTEVFHTKYRYADVLLVDDIQFISSSKATQEEFFHTFNALKGANKQIVMTSDRPPKEMSQLEERLRTRFEQGLLVDITVPEYETRVAIIKNKAMRENVEIPDKVVTFLAEKLRSNIRQLEGAVMNLVAESTMRGVPITTQLAERLVGDMVTNNATKESVKKNIISAVCEMFGVTENDIKSENRQHDIIVARQVCMYIMRDVMNFSLSEIGEEMGGKNHSTVNYSINKVIELMRADAVLSANVKSIINTVKNE